MRSFCALDNFIHLTWLEQNFSLFIYHRVFGNFFAFVMAMKTVSCCQLNAVDQMFFHSFLIDRCLIQCIFTWKTVFAWTKMSQEVNVKRFHSFYFLLSCITFFSYKLARYRHCGCIKFIGFESNSSYGSTMAAIASLQIIVISLFWELKKLYCSSSLSLKWCLIIKQRPDDVNLLLIG